MKNFSIESPCTENWNEMSPTQKGAFCQKCTIEVHDFTNKSNDEIRSVLLNNSGKQVCGRYTSEQPASLNAEYDAWKFNSQRIMQRAMIFSLVVVFGLTLFSCNNKQDANALEQMQHSVTEVVSNVDQVASDLKVEVVKHKAIEQEISIKSLDHVAQIIEKQAVRRDIACTKQNLQAVQDIHTINRVEEKIYMLGMSVRSASYEDYLVELEPKEIDVLKEIELDVNGLEFPEVFESKVYPNPTREATSLEVKMPSNQEQVVINLFDMSGSHVQSIYDGELERGTHTYGMNLIDLKPGIYLVTILSADFKETVRISKN